MFQVVHTVSPRAWLFAGFFFVSYARQLTRCDTGACPQSPRQHRLPAPDTGQRSLPRRMSAIQFTAGGKREGQLPILRAPPARLVRTMHVLTEIHLTHRRVVCTVCASRCVGNPSCTCEGSPRARAKNVHVIATWWWPSKRCHCTVGSFKVFDIVNA